MNKLGRDVAVSRIGVHTAMTGELHYKHQLIIEGKYRGTVLGGTELIVAVGAQFDGTIKAEHVKIYGAVKGDISATKSLTISNGAVVQGAVNTPALRIIDGAVFKGTCTMTENSKTPPVPAASESAKQPSPAAASA